jgi:hypothetical protein
MKVQLFVIKQAEEVLKEMYKTKIPDSVLAFRFHKFMKVVSDELADLERSRSGLVDVFGEKHEDGSTRVTEENTGKFFSEYEKLLTTEVDLPKFQFSLGELINFNLSSEQLGLIEFIIEEPAD